MKLLKKRTELPFLMAMGVLFILSASFLGLQLWSEDHSGAALALEAPVMPPSLNAPQVVVAPPAVREKPPEVVEEYKTFKYNKKSEAKPEKAAKTSAKREDSYKRQKKEEERRSKKRRSAKRKTGAALQMPGAARQIAKQEKVADKAVEKTPDNHKDKEVSVVVGAPEVIEPEAKKEVQSPSKEARSNNNPVEMTEKSEEIDAGKSAKKTAKEPAAEAKKPEVKKQPEAVKNAAEDKTVTPVAERKAKKVVVQKRRAVAVPTEVPPEWDWFSTPLKLEVEDDGKVELLPGTGKVTLDEKLRDAVAIEPGLVNETQKRFQRIVVSRLPEKALDKKNETEEKPFSMALSKMKRLKAGRKASVKHMPEVGSPSLKRLQGMLHYLRVRADNNESKLSVGRRLPHASVPGKGALGSVNASVEDESKGLNEGRKTSRNGSAGLQMRYYVRSGSWLNN
jgi:hypothetical protein